MMDEDIQTGELTGEAAAELLTGDPAAGGTPAAEENAQVEAFKAKAEDEVAKRQAAEEENRRLNEQLLAMANPTQEARRDVFDGLEDYENPTVAQIRQAQAEQYQQTQQLLGNIQVNNFISSKSDFSEIVGTYGPRGLNSAETLKDLIKDNPSMRVLTTLPATAAPYVYHVAKEHKELKELRAQQAALSEHTSGVEARTGPLSPAAVGGGGGGSTNTEPTDEQVESQFDRALSGEFG